MILIKIYNDKVSFCAYIEVWGAADSWKRQLDIAAIILRRGSHGTAFFALKGGDRLQRKKLDQGICDKKDTELHGRNIRWEKVVYAAYLVFSLLLIMAAPVYASDIFGIAKNAMQTVYTDVAGIATVAAVVCAAVCLFLMNFSKSGRTVDESRSWLKRIVICWAALMTLGAIVTYFQKIIPQSAFSG